jgi:nucleoside-diphosphate-sugar epimerase
MSFNVKNIIITGSSGYVGSFLIPLLKERFNVSAIDMSQGAHTNIVSDIAADDLRDKLSADEDYLVIHCAAARFDYGINANVYFEENVSKTKAFLNTLAALNITQFIHVSSVAAIDGEALDYNDGLDCDNAYRVTKYLQQCEVIDWCRQNKVPWDVVMPSAIYDDVPRRDTNIGKLQAVTRFFAILPKIEVKKSLTYLPKFCAFIEERIEAPSGSCFLTIEKPVRTVTQIMRDQAGRRIWSIYVPGLKLGLFFLSWVSLGMAALLRRQPMLTPPRVIKLFSDTSYATYDGDIDRTTYDGSKL